MESNNSKKCSRTKVSRNKNDISMVDRANSEDGSFERASVDLVLFNLEGSILY